MTAIETFLFAVVFVGVMTFAAGVTLPRRSRRVRRKMVR